MGWYNLAAEMRKAGDDDAAIQMYQRVIELRPQELQAYEHLGMIYSSRHQEDQAVEWFRRAMKYGADDYATLINFATALGRQNDLEGCESIARKAIRLRPQSGAGYTILGQSLAAQGRADDAIAALRKAVDVEPSSAMAHATLAAALANRGEIDDAIKECRAAIAQDAGFSPAKQLLNQLLQASSRPEDQK
jgi:tetratricopeptide (TPR) repeat protein